MINKKKCPEVLHHFGAAMVSPYQLGGELGI